MRAKRAGITLTGTGVLAMAVIAVFMLNFGGAIAQSPNQGTQPG